MATFDRTKISNPVLSLPTLHVRDPAVLLADDRVHLFFTLFDPSARTWHVASSTTQDFIHWTEVVKISPEGYASPGNILNFQDKWVLCYQQYRQFPHTICLSWSDDLVKWGPPIEVFNTGPKNAWNEDGRVIDPYMIEWEKTYYCYYTGSTRWGKPSGYNLIGVARSDNLIDWEDLSTEKPIIGVEYPWEEPDGNENNCVIRHGDEWFMLYSASLMHQRIAWAVSEDLIHWQKGGLCQVPPFEASRRRFGAPFLIEGLSEGNRYLMIFQGEDEKGHMSFLLLESEDLINWF